METRTMLLTVGLAVMIMREYTRSSLKSKIYSTIILLLIITSTITIYYTITIMSTLKTSATHQIIYFPLLFACYSTSCMTLIAFMAQSKGGVENLNEWNTSLTKYLIITFLIFVSIFFVIGCIFRILSNDWQELNIAMTMAPILSIIIGTMIGYGEEFKKNKQ